MIYLLKNGDFPQPDGIDVASGYDIHSSPWLSHGPFIDGLPIKKWLWLT